MNVPQDNGDRSETSFYPSCVVHLRVRMDTSYRYEVPTARSAADMLSPSPTAPLFTLSGDGFSRVNGLVPMTCSVELSAYRKGGRFSFKVPFKDFPIHSSLIKAASAKIYAGTVPGSEFAAGMSESPPTNASDRLYWKRRSVIDCTDDNLLISGPLDMPKLHWSAGEAEVSFEGRDNVAILADPHIDPSLMASVDVTKPIDEVVGQILSLHPLVQDRKIDPFVVVSQPEDWPNGVLRSPGDRDGLTRVRKKASGKGAQIHPGADTTSSVSYWDLIVQYCSLVAAVPWFQPDGTLLIRPAVGLHDWQWAERNADPNFKTPFAGNRQRTLKDGSGTPRQISYRRIVYGRNIDDLTWERKTSGVKARVVQVVSLDDDAEGRGAAQKLLIAEFPKKSITASGKGDKAKVSSVTPEGDKASTDVLRVPVFGIRSMEVLEEIAEGIFNEVMHQEISGHLQTKALTSFGGTNGDPDLLRLRVGDPLQVLVDAAAFNAAAPHIAEVLVHERRSFEEEVASIKAKVGNDENFARAIVATARNLVPGLQNTFRTSGVKFEFNMSGQDPSVSVSADFQNYVEIQYTGQNRAPVGKASKQPKRTTP